MVDNDFFADTTRFDDVIEEERTGFKLKFQLLTHVFSLLIVYSFRYGPHHKNKSIKKVSQRMASTTAQTT